MGKLFSSVFQLLLCASCFGCVLPAYAQLVDVAGFRWLAVIDPVGKQPVEAVYFYPSAVSDHTLSTFGPYHVAARNAVKMAPGRYPLVVISHGNAGSLWSHHDLATSLAQQGNIVITLSHPGDNYKDQSGVGASSTIYGRPLQISAVITAALDNPDLAAHIDPSKIAFIGFSAGGTTGLLLGGGKIDLERYTSYCKKNQTEAICSTQGKIKNDRADLSPQADPRIKAWVLMAPVSMMFSPESLKTLTAPTLIFTGDKDEELSWRLNAGTLAETLPSKPELKVIPNAGHFVFLSPCSSQLRAITPMLCEDPPGVDRTAVHRRINDEIDRFLKSIWQEGGSE